MHSPFIVVSVYKTTVMNAIIFKEKRENINYKYSLFSDILKNFI